MHQERPVRDVLDFDSRDRPRRRHDAVDVIHVAGEHRDVADLLTRLDPHEVDRAEEATCVGDRPRGVGECTGPVVQVQPQRRAEGG